MNRITITPDDRARVVQALDTLQSAQALLDAAARQLSPVPGFAEQWSYVGSVRAEVNALWHAIDHRLPREAR